MGFLAFLSAAPSWSAPINVAVNDLLPRGVDTSDALIVSDRLRSELLSTGRFRVMERGQMDQILREQAFQQSGACDQSECAVQIGKLLSVDRMIVGAVGRLGEVYTLQARILDVGTGEIVFSANQDFEGRVDGLLSSAIPRLAARLAAATRTDSAGGKADLYVNASERGAEIYLDGKKVGGSPLNLPGLPAGDHRLEVRKGNLYGAMSLELRPDDVRRLDIPLEIGMGNVKLYSDPAGAVAVLDSGKSLGPTPLRADRITMGSHRLSLSLPGHVPVEDSVEILPGQTTTRRYVLHPGARAAIALSVPARGVFAGDSGDTIRSLLPGTLWLRSGHWSLSVEAGKDWSPWVGALEVGVSDLSVAVPLSHSKAWTDSVASVRHRSHVLTWRWTTGLAFLAAAGAATWFHVQAARASDDASAAKSDYQSLGPGADFEAAKARYRSAVDRNHNRSSYALGSDVAAGVLGTGFLLTFAF